MIDLYIFILIPILVAILMYLFPKKNMKIFVIFIQIILLILSFKNFIYVKSMGTVVQVLGGYSSAIGIGLRADILSSILVVLTLFLFLSMLIFSYDKDYINHLFIFLFLILQGLIIGVFYSEDLFNIYVLLEVSTMVVSILIMFKKDKRSIYDGMVYLLVNIAAMTMFLFGIGYLYKVFGVLNIYNINELMSSVNNSKSMILPYALIITAVGLKSALMPLFSWLPKAHGTPSAPSIVSAILSGLYVKTGIYLFIRMQFMFSPVFDTGNIFLILGLLTGVIGFFFALAQTDIKLILAYSTVSQIGLIMIGINYPNTYSYWGGIYHLLNHAIFKSVLFLTAGLIIEEYKTRNIYEIRGVFKRMPLISIATILAILGVTGAPLFNGSVSKYLIQKGTVGTFMEYAIIFVNLGTIIYYVKYSSMLFNSGDNIYINKFSNLFMKKKNIDNILQESDKSIIDTIRVNSNFGIVESENISFNKKLVVLTLGAICFLGGIFGEEIILFLFSQENHISVGSYIHKGQVYIISIIAGVIIYNFIILKSKLLNKVREIELSFNYICLSIVIFFFLMTVLLYITV
ncbi:complex I subunit 5 family protein [Clostridium sp. DL1XJH146]